MILFATNDRNACHQKLEVAIAEGTFPAAFCQEDPNAAEVYQVHHGLDNLTPDQLNKVDAIIAALKS